jgi:tetratricopeptide (TPR) repeat protein
VIKSFLNWPLWARFPLAFTIGLIISYYLEQTTDLPARILPSLFVLCQTLICLYPELLLLTARELSKLKEDNLVEIVCKHSLDLMPSNCRILIDQYNSLMAMKRYQEAKTYSDWAARIAPGMWRAWYSSAVVAMWLDDYEGAAINIERALEVAPRNQYALAARAYIRNYLGDQQGCFEDCARIDPKSKMGPEIRKLSAIVHIRAANFQAAENIVSKLPKHPKAGSDDAVTLAYFKFSQNQFSEIVTICSQVPEDHPAAYWFLEVKSSAYRRLNEGALALQSISQSIAMRPERTDGYRRKALVLADAGLLNQALVACKRNEVLGKKETSRKAEAYVRFRRGEFAEMLECTKLAITASPKSAYVHALNSLALAGLGRVDEALDEAIKATELHNLEALAWYALANAHLKQGQVEQAISDLNTGLEADPHFRISYLLRAEAHRRAGHEVEADRDKSKFDQLQTKFMANLQ